jgi:hypothetical protein
MLNLFTTIVIFIRYNVHSYIYYINYILYYIFIGSLNYNDEHLIIFSFVLFK